MAAEGLYLLSHHFEKKDAKTMMKKEFRMLNQDTVISVVSAVYSLTSIQMTIPQIPAKQIARTIFDPRIRLEVCFHSRYKTQVMIIRGTTVKRVFTMLNTEADIPVRVLSTESLAKMIREVAPCSKDIQKNTVKNAKMITAIILSLTIFVYRAILETTRIRNKINPMIAIPRGPEKGSP